MTRQLSRNFPFDVANSRTIPAYSQRQVAGNHDPLLAVRRFHQPLLQAGQRPTIDSVASSALTGDPSAIVRWRFQI